MSKIVSITAELIFLVQQFCINFNTRLKLKSLHNPQKGPFFLEVFLWCLNNITLQADHCHGATWLYWQNKLEECFIKSRWTVYKVYMWTQLTVVEQFANKTEIRESLGLFLNNYVGVFIKNFFTKCTCVGKNTRVWLDRIKWRQVSGRRKSPTLSLAQNMKLRKTNKHHDWKLSQVQT